MRHLVLSQDFFFFFLLLSLFSVLVCGSSFVAFTWYYEKANLVLKSVSCFRSCGVFFFFRCILFILLITYEMKSLVTSLCHESLSQVLFCLTPIICIDYIELDSV